MNKYYFLETTINGAKHSTCKYKSEEDARGEMVRRTESVTKQIAYWLKMIDKNRSNGNEIPERIIEFPNTLKVIKTHLETAELKTIETTDTIFNTVNGELVLSKIQLHFIKTLYRDLNVSDEDAVTKFTTACLETFQTAQELLNKCFELDVFPPLSYNDI